MDTENATMLGTAMITLTSLLGSYYMILKIREQHSERPDPKLTYVTHAQMDKLKEETMQSISEAVRDLRALRAEIREETRAVQKQHARSLSETRDLVGTNSGTTHSRTFGKDRQNRLENEGGNLRCATNFCSDAHC